MARSRTLELDAFDSIDIATGVEVVVTRGTPQSVRVEAAHDGQIDRFDIFVSDGRLHVRRRRGLIDLPFLGGMGGFLGSERNVIINMTVPELVAIAATNGASVTINGLSGDEVAIEVATRAAVEIDAVKAADLSLDVSTNGILSISGICDRLKTRFASAGHISAMELACTDIAVTGSHGASLDTTAFGRATGTLHSGAYLHLNGRPDVSAIKTGSGASISVG